MQAVPLDFLTPCRFNPIHVSGHCLILGMIPLRHVRTFNSCAQVVCVYVSSRKAVSRSMPMHDKFFPGL